MQHMLLIYEPPGVYDGPAGEARLMDVVQKHRALAEDLRAKGLMKDGSGLAPTTSARTVATAEGGQQTVHDGPFAETREQLGGYYLVDVPDLETAVAIARRIPVADGGKVEVRPLMYG
jgi:hypothetical protein